MHCVSDEQYSRVPLSRLARTLSTSPLSESVILLGAHMRETQLFRARCSTRRHARPKRVVAILHTPAVVISRAVGNYPQWLRFYHW